MDATNQKYLPTVGIETHVQLKTKTKLFSAVDNDARQAAPNTLISHIDVGLPGALPVLNQAAIELSARAAFALNTKPQKFSRFDRKHYFYPDLPKGYQITQYEQPIILGGYVEVPVDGEVKKVGIERANLEEDAGKNIHPAGANYSLVDLNRAGTPLLEIVSQPDIHSAAEAKAYVREIWLLMKYAGVTDGDLYHGHVRFDVNVSVSKDPAKKGTRSETKNLNSFRSVENAITYEISRQIELLEKGEKIVQETLGWDEAKQETVSQRGKEEAHDYRYMPEPDIPPIEPDEGMVYEAKKNMQRLPNEWRKILNKLSISKEGIEILLEADAERGGIDFLMFIEEALEESEDTAAQEANLMVNIEIPLMREKEAAIVPQSAKWALIYQPVIKLINEKKLNSTLAKKLLSDLLASKELPENIEEYAKEKNYLQVSDELEIDKFVAKVISENQQAVEDVKNGETKAIGFLVGQVMVKSQGKANPQIAQQIIEKQLGLK